MRAMSREQTCQLYRHYDEADRLLYVGISHNFMLRMRQHKSGANWFRQIAKVTVEHFDTRTEAERAERDAILYELPIYNVRRPTPFLPRPTSTCPIPQSLREQADQSDFRISVDQDCTVRVELKPDSDADEVAKMAAAMHDWAVQSGARTPTVWPSDRWSDCPVLPSIYGL